jgi:CubicO group peptidase (beta-lactamase class C family)
VGFRPVGPGLLSADEAARIAPTEVYDPRLHAAGSPAWFAVRADRDCAHGEVHDDNAYAMGGVAGHAGLFGTAEAVLVLARAWLAGQLPGVDAELTRRFFRRSAVSTSTRRLGWDGESPDGSGSSGGALGPEAVGHTGYTGTSLWLDPATRAVYVLLSNRVHPTRENESIRSLRRWFHQIAVRL